MYVGGGLLVVLLLQGGADALAAAPQVDQVLHPLLALGHPALGQVQLPNLSSESLCHTLYDHLYGLYLVPSLADPPEARGCSTNTAVINQFSL